MRMKKIKEYDYLLITLLCSSLVIIISFILKDIAPFGRESLLEIDFFHQYGPMLSELYDRITNGSSLLYSFRMGVGLPFYRNFFNYLSSPFNIIMFLFSRKNVIMSLSLIIGVKAIASSLTMCFYLNKKFGKNYLFIPLSIFYAFSAYYIAYHWNIMWLDGMVFLPIIAYGIEKIVDNNNVLLYVIGLSLAIISNYFIGYMLCIFSLLYFIMYLVLKTNKLDAKNIINKCILFGISSLLVGGICAVFILPMYLALSETSAVKDSIPTNLYYSFKFKEFAFNHLSAVGSTVLSTDPSVAPNISVGIIPFALLITFIFNSKISIKTKLCYLSLLVVIALGFFVPVFDFIWHAMHVPNDLPYRFSFIYSFVVILIAAYSINNLKGIDKLDASLVLLGTLLLITLAKKYNVGNINNTAMILNYVLILISYIIFILKDKMKYKYILVIIIAILSITNGVYGIYNNWKPDQTINDYYLDYEPTKDLVNSINDNEFYRIEKDYIKSFSDPCWYGYNGVVGFSSMEYERLTTFINSLGLPTNGINSFYHRYNTPIYNMMFNLRYVIGENDLNYYEMIKEGVYDNLYKFKYNTSLMYGVKKDIKNYLKEIDNPFINQNDFIKLSTGVGNVLSEMEVEEQEIVYEDDYHTIVKYYVKNNYDNYYLYFDHPDVDFLITNNKLFYNNDDHEYYINVNELEIDEIYDYNEKHIITNSVNDEYITFYIGYNYYDGDVYDIFELDKNKWNDAYNYLNNNALKIRMFNENKIETYSNFDEDKTIYTSIPYDKGWEVYIDNKKVETFKIGDAMLGFDVTKSKHDIRLEYHIPYIKIGSIVSISSLIGLMLLNIIIDKKHINK